MLTASRDAESRVELEQLPKVWRLRSFAADVADSPVEDTGLAIVRVAARLPWMQ